MRPYFLRSNLLYSLQDFTHKAVITISRRNDTEDAIQLYLTMIIREVGGNYWGHTLCVLKGIADT